MNNPTVTAYSPDMQDRHHDMPAAFTGMLDERSGADDWCMDLGTGTGQVAFYLASRVRWVLGLDTRGDAIEAARRRAQNEGIVNVQFMIADVENTRLDEMSPMGSFNLIAANLYLSDRAVELAAPALADGGSFCCVCFADDHWQEAGEGTSHSYSEKRLRDLMQANDLTVEELRTETRQITFDNLDQVVSYLPQRLLKRWQEDGRWRALQRSFESGNTSLTESKHILAARR